MTNINIKISKAGRTNTIIMISTFVVAVIGIMYIQQIGSAYAFIQHVRVIIDKGPYNLGSYTVFTENRDTGNSYTDNRVDSTGNSEIVGYDYNIEANDGDHITACIMKQDTNQVACQNGFANAAYDLIYHLYWRDAIIVNP